MNGTLLNCSLFEHSTGFCQSYSLRKWPKFIRLHFFFRAVLSDSLMCGKPYGTCVVDDVSYCNSHRDHYCRKWLPIKIKVTLLWLTTYFYSQVNQQDSRYSHVNQQDTRKLIIMFACPIRLSILMTPAAKRLMIWAEFTGKLEMKHKSRGGYFWSFCNRIRGHVPCIIHNVR